ncbi:MAG TPA: alpha/beta hydrolase [Acidimicrobiales bacterium]|jgi:3-oxoadipate enol-lactonase|nr:alpha/beta hydrolase [Acidimicrobiales bacterium]
MHDAALVRNVTTRAGGEIYVNVRGSGPPLVWVAGLGDDHTSFDAQVDRFVDQYTCVVYDNRGTGRSTTLPGPYTMKDYADDAHDVVAALGLAPVSAVGSSMGGAIVETWALHYPDDVELLVLSNSWAEHDPLLDLLFGHWTSLAMDGVNDRLAESLLMGCFSGEHFKRFPELIPEFLATPLPDMDGLKAAIAACRSHDLLDRLAEINVPTLVLSASQDVVVRPQMSSRMADRLPKSQLVEIDSGHMIMWERPDLFAEAIKTFIEGHFATAPIAQ